MSEQDLSAILSTLVQKPDFCGKTIDENINDAIAIAKDMFPFLLGLIPQSTINAKKQEHSVILQKLKNNEQFQESCAKRDISKLTGYVMNAILLKQLPNSKERVNRIARIKNPFLPQARGGTRHKKQKSKRRTCKN